MIPLDESAPEKWGDIYEMGRPTHLRLLPKEPMQEELPLDAPVKPVFKGATFDPTHDQARLETALGRIKAAMAGGQKFSLRELALIGQCSEAGASARCRDLRRVYHWSIVSERVKGGVWSYYRVVP